MSYNDSIIIIKTKKQKTKKKTKQKYNLLAKSGIEPNLTDHETVVLPLHYLA
jgi:hypothetical protein